MPSVVSRRRRSGVISWPEDGERWSSNSRTNMHQPAVGADGECTAFENCRCFLEREAQRDVWLKIEHASKGGSISDAFRGTEKNELAAVAPVKVVTNHG